MLEIFIGKQVTKRYYYSKEITLSEGILGSILWNSQLYVQIRIRDIIARLIGKQPLTVSTYIAKLCDHTQVLFELLPIYFIKIFGNFGLNILRCKAVKLGQRTKSYAIEQHPKRHIPIHLPLMIYIWIVTVMVCQISMRRHQSVDAACVSAAQCIVRGVQIFALLFPMFFTEVIGNACFFSPISWRCFRSISGR